MSSRTPTESASRPLRIGDQRVLLPRRSRAARLQGQDPALRRGVDARPGSAGPARWPDLVPTVVAGRRRSRSPTYVDRPRRTAARTAASDVCPRSYGEEPLRPEWEGDEIRDRYEIELIHALPRRGQARARHLPRHPDPQRGLRRHALPGHPPGRRGAAGSAGTTRNWDIYDANRHELDDRNRTGRTWPTLVAGELPGAVTGREQRAPPGGEGRGRRARGRGPLDRRRHRRGRAARAPTTATWPRCSGTPSSRRRRRRPMFDDRPDAGRVPGRGRRAARRRRPSAPASDDRRRDRRCHGGGP